MAATKLGVFAPGPYNATFNTDAAAGSPSGKTLGAQDLGLVQGVRSFSRTVEGKDITADLYGATVIDGIYRGGQVFTSMIFKEWAGPQQDALWPFGGEPNDFGLVGPIGELMTNLAGVLVLTAVAGTPAAATDSRLITLHSSIIAPGHSYDLFLGSEERDIPIVFRNYPVLDEPNPSDPARWATFAA